ncbi:PAS domain S-box protein [bacterium]|nr:PAS domain S-box protein [bacterium]MBU1990150.1 PAS domain S-box protein [bacterium]
MSNHSFSTFDVSIDFIPLNVAVYEYVGDGFCIVDFNTMAEQTENVKREDIIGKRLEKVFPGVKDFGLFDVLLRVYEKGGCEDADLGFYDDGRVSGWRKNRVCRLENGNVIALYSDMTVQKDIESRLESLGIILDNSINEVYIFNKEDLHFTYLNKAAQKNIGYTISEMQTMTPVDIKPEYDLKSFLELIEPLMRGEKDFLVFETVHERKDGTRYNAEIRLQSVNRGNTEQFVVLTHDITDRKNAQSKLLESEEKFRNIAENALMGIFIYKERGLYANQALVEISGYSTQELYAMSPWDLVTQEYKEQVRNISKRRLRGEKFPQEYEDIKLVKKDGKIRTVRISTQTIMYGNAYAGMGTMIDITDIQETKQQLKLLAQAVEQMDELVRITDKDGIITYVNDALVAHTGYKHVELLGKKIGLYKSGLHKKEFYKELWETIASGKTFRGVFINRKKDGQIYYEEETITPIVDDKQNIQYYVATSQDITDRVKMEEKLHTLATIDSITCIYNRNKIGEELDIEIARAKRYESSFALIMFDIDFFKAVNDRYGHDMGDYVLKELCAVVSKLIRESDRFGRWGGEEFIIITPIIQKEQVMLLANKLKDVIATHAFKEISKVTISIGITLLGREDTKESLLKRVDNALYESKNRGRNRVSFK